MPRIAIPLTLAVWLAVTPGAALAQMESSSPDVAAELARLNATLIELRDLLEQQIETQGLDLLLKRSQILSQEMLQIETHLRSVKSTQRSLGDEKSRMETQIEIFRERERAGNMEPEELETMLLQFEAAYKQVTGQLRDIESEAAELESRLMRKQEDLEAWQDLLDRRLGGF